MTTLKEKNNNDSNKNIQNIVKKLDKLEPECLKKYDRDLEAVVDTFYKSEISISLQHDDDVGDILDIFCFNEITEGKDFFVVKYDVIDNDVSLDLEHYSYYKSDSDCFSFKMAFFDHENDDFYDDSHFMGNYDKIVKIKELQNGVNEFNIEYGGDTNCSILFDFVFLTRREEDDDHSCVTNDSYYDNPDNSLSDDSFNISEDYFNNDSNAEEELETFIIKGVSIIVWKNKRRKMNYKIEKSKIIEDLVKFNEKYGSIEEYEKSTKMSILKIKKQVIEQRTIKI